jgi:MFS transporter, DHA2 family, multidrug resistance protein
VVVPAHRITPGTRAHPAPAYGRALLSLLTTSFYAGLISFLLPYYIADVLGGSAELTGIALLFFVGAMAPISFAAGALTDRVGTLRVALLGSVIGVAGLASMITLDAGADLFDMAWRMVVLGLGAALFNTAINTAMLQSAPSGSEGVAGGVAMTTRTIAMTIGPAVSALAWTVAGGGLAGFRAGAAVVTATAVIGLAVLLIPVRKR